MNNIPQPSGAAAVEEGDNQTSYRREQADAYLRKHRIVDLFEDLCTKICFKQPEDIDAFVVEQLKQKQQHGFKTGVYSDEEIGNVFFLFDLKREGQISRKACMEALKVLVSSEYQLRQVEENALLIPEKVDIAQFVRLCQSIIGVTMQI